MLTLLLSSYFIFNSTGTIDEGALSNLSLIINLTKNLQIQNEELVGECDPEEIQRYFPRFLWVVRDFALKLQDEDFNPITQKQYLENSLKETPGCSEKIENRNKIRRLIKTFFKDRDC